MQLEAHEIWKRQQLEEFKNAIAAMWKLLPKGYGERYLPDHSETEALYVLFLKWHHELSDRHYRVINELLRWKDRGMLCHYDSACADFVKEFANLEIKQ
jgi:hypothetical protein